MTHEDALNEILSNACGMLDEDQVKANGGIQEYYLELHCSVIHVKAKSLGNLKYEIVSVEWLKEQPKH